jgi:retron-type reverse transcriptase
VEAFKRVKANRGAAGVEGQSIADFEASLSGNLYTLRNRLSSGSYFPPPVRRVNIPKAEGWTRPLGIPTVADRVAQESSSCNGLPAQNAMPPTPHCPLQRDIFSECFTLERV